VLFDDGDKEDMTGSELMAALTTHAEHYAVEGQATIVIPPSSRIDLLRRVRKHFEGHGTFEGSVVDFADNRPRAPPVARGGGAGGGGASSSSSSSGRGSGGGGGGGGGGGRGGDGGRGGRKPKKPGPKSKKNSESVV
jgi:hypothetical protein